VMISGAHWAVATTLAVVVHLAGMLWLSLASPERQVTTEDTGEGIVVTLGRAARVASEPADAATPEESGSVTMPEAGAQEPPEAVEEARDSAPPAPEETVSEAAAPEPEPQSLDSASPDAPPAVDPAIEAAAAGGAPAETTAAEPAAATASEAAGPEPVGPETTGSRQVDDVSSAPTPQSVDAEELRTSPEPVEADTAPEPAGAVTVEEAATRSASPAAPGEAEDSPVTTAETAVAGAEVRTSETVPVEGAAAAPGRQAAAVTARESDGAGDAPTATEAGAETATAAGAETAAAEPAADSARPVEGAALETAAPGVETATAGPAADNARSVEEVATTAPDASRPQVELEAVAPVGADTADVDVAAAREPSPDVSSSATPEVTESTAPETVRLRDLQQRSGGAGVVARYAGVLKGWLQKNMHYPRAARLAGQEGDVVVRFVIDRDGNVQSVELESGSGYELLDREATEMVERGDPFPAMPVDMPGDRLEVRVPVSFHVRDETLTKDLPPIYLE